MRFSPVLLLALFFPSLLHAFCIYNDSENVTLFLRQNVKNRGAIFSKTFQVDGLKPSEKACCAYTNYDCNKSGKPEEYVSIYTGAKWDGGHVSDFQIGIPAGGWAVFTGKSELFKIQAYYANGEPADFKLEKRPDSYALY
ncbi:hypothetical protein A0J61_04758 [Choanephora cucurbitarum]|uniref:Uncharacterized protein n=1 Tax=Choanephora cucurbitarum TaxID=101091 RepID=A0A1C7NDL7_9FUNG|nr:hypothetical protein A0J61_04758 [Choanephora cucurbitarum]